jgi:hypothetical protein
MKKNKMPTILGILILVAGLAAGVFLIQNQQVFKLGAAPEAAPKDVRITNVTDGSFTASWVTDKQTSGFIKYSDNDSSFDKTELDEITESSYTHYLTVQALSPQTNYHFKINSGGDDYDNNGVSWQVKTGAKLVQPETTNIISGNVVTSSGNPAKNALVYASAAGAGLLSAVTSENGSYLFPLSLARTQDLSSYSLIDNTSTIVEISVQAGPSGVASAQIYPQSAKPAPSIILGQVHDFKNLPASETSEIPEAELGLPSTSSPSSGFKVDETPKPSDSESVTLESVDEGEVVTSTTPEFFGEGPAGATITITVESDPITDSVKVGSSGSWNWSPPSGIPEGTHKITLSWRDASGILRTLTRTFVVQAAEGPAFESTPSASPTSSPTPSPSSSVAPSASPTPTASSTPAPVPDSGSLTPTIVLSIMGIGLLLLSGIAAFLAYEKEA